MIARGMPGRTPEERAISAIAAFDAHEAHGPIDGEGIQRAVDLDCALAEAGVPVGAADGISREQIAGLLGGEGAA